MAEMSPALRNAFASHRDDPDHREPVIVTVETGCDLADVAGLDVTGTARSGTIVMATATADAARRLEEHDGVVRVEHDGGDMRALD
jgi:hypothetical protein